MAASRQPEAASWPQVLAVLSRVARGDAVDDDEVVAALVVLDRLRDAAGAVTGGAAAGGAAAGGAAAGGAEARGAAAGGLDGDGWTRVGPVPVGWGTRVIHVFGPGGDGLALTLAEDGRCRGGAFVAGDLAAAFTVSEPAGGDGVGDTDGDGPGDDAGRVELWVDPGDGVRRIATSSFAGARDVTRGAGDPVGSGWFPIAATPWYRRPADTPAEGTDAAEATGPLSADQLVRLRRSGGMGDEDLLWRPGWNDWRACAQAWHEVAREAPYA